MKKITMDAKPKRDHQYRPAGYGECADRHATKPGRVQPAARANEGNKCAKAACEE